MLIENCSGVFWHKVNVSTDKSVFNTMGHLKFSASYHIHYSWHWTQRFFEILSNL